MYGRSSATVVVVKADPKMALPPPPRSTPQTLKGSCLMCFDPVFIANEDTNAVKTRDEVIKTLCFHMNMNPKSVPNTCTAEMFPLCSACERRVKLIWEQEKIIKEANQKISKGIMEIERTVAETELIKPTNMTRITAGGEKPFMELRDKILDGYRTKLIMKKKLREKITYEFVSSANEVELAGCSKLLIEDESLRREFKAKSRQSRGVSSVNSVKLNDVKAQTTALATSSATRNGDGVTVNVNPLDVAEMNASFSSVPDENSEEGHSGTGNNNALVPVIPSPPSTSQQSLPSPKRRRPRSKTLKYKTRKSRSRKNSRLSRITAPEVVYNENNCTMVISNVSGRSLSPSQNSSPVVKEEPEDDADTRESMSGGKRRRRLFFQGIEIKKVTSPLNNHRYFKCSICNWTTPVGASKSSTINALTPVQIMKEHITKHFCLKKKRAITSGATLKSSRATKRYHTCNLCQPPKSFESAKALLDHRTVTHLAISNDIVAPGPSRVKQSSNINSPKYYVPDLECDICGRPVKGNVSNLMIHRFSHKNNEERMAAQAAGEKGSRNVLMRSNSAKKPQGKQRVVIKYSNKAKLAKSRRGRKRKLIIQTESSAVVPVVECNLCNRTFTRNCHLALHMAGHARRSDITAPPPKKKRIATGEQLTHEKDNEDEMSDTEVEQSDNHDQDELDDETRHLQENVPCPDESAQVQDDVNVSNEIVGANHEKDLLGESQEMQIGSE